jgi:hypothetical protein
MRLIPQGKTHQALSKAASQTDLFTDAEVRKTQRISDALSSMRTSNERESENIGQMQQLTRQSVAGWRPDLLPQQNSVNRHRSLIARLD